jgi:hypothetical protein
MTSKTRQAAIVTARTVIILLALEFWVSAAALTWFSLLCTQRSTVQWKAEFRIRATRDRARNFTMQSSQRMPVVVGVATALLLVAYSARADEKPMMKAVVAHEYGTPEVLKFEEVPRAKRRRNACACHREQR